MFGVHDEPAGRARRLGRAGLIIALILLAFVAGPGVLVYALLDALYRDVPASASGPTGARPLPVLSSSAMADRNLSPVAEPILGGEGILLGRPVKLGRAVPLKAYLSLRGTAERKNFTLTAHATRDGQGGFANRTFRTVCVRLCDGYYFPVGFSATPDQFGNHEARCRSSCGSPARLFVYPNPGGNPAQMRDLAGNPYLELETAFRFHTGFDSSCSCQPQPWSLAARQRHRAYASYVARPGADLVAMAPASLGVHQVRSAPVIAALPVGIAAREPPLR